MKNCVWIYLLVAALVALTGCGPGFQARNFDNPPPVGEPGEDGLIVKSRSVFLVTTQNGRTTVQKIQNLILPMAYASNPTSIPISVVNVPDASMTVDSTQFLAPAITSDVLDFGSIEITNIRDNNLRMCGANGKQKCSQAVIRIYTTGVAGAGLWNGDDGYGAPILAGMGSDRATVGLSALNAAIVQTYRIPHNKNTIRMGDFGEPMIYNFDVDFSNAGAGTYSTTLVVEYGLAL